MATATLLRIASTKFRYSNVENMKQASYIGDDL